MNIAEIRRLVKLVETSGISELDIEQDGSRIKISKNLQADSALLQSLQSQLIQAPQATFIERLDQPVKTASTEEARDDNMIAVTSPMVGTFYRAPAPEAPSYVQVGDHVNPGQVLCIIEAMKLMNEIEAEVSGIIEKINVENAEPVEYGHKLFVIRPD